MTHMLLLFCFSSIKSFEYDFEYKINDLIKMNGLKSHFQNDSNLQIGILDSGISKKFAKKFP